MLLRRELIIFALSGWVTSAKASEEDWQALLSAAVKDQDPLFQGRLIPSPSDPIWAEAEAVLAKAPRNRPYDVARYLSTSIPSKFQMAWPEPDPRNPTLANPVIVLFFLATKLRPLGDKTAWCAAFVNWCLDRAGVPGTHSASSQSFRSWGNRVWHVDDGDMPVQARTGDIAVFQSRANPGHGHVGFFKGINPSQPHHVDILGGNQFTSSHLHVIDVKSLRTDAGLKLVEIRTYPGLRRA